MQELEQEYARLQTVYQTLASNTSVPTPEVIGKLRTTNSAIADVLGKMIAILAQTRDEGQGIEQYRDQLVQRLQKIQTDYNNLKVNTDHLETLRRIREYEASKSEGSLNWYLLGFFVLCVVVLIFMLAFGHVRSEDAIAAMEATPAINAPFT